MLGNIGLGIQEAKAKLIELRNEIIKQTKQRDYIIDTLGQQRLAKNEVEVGKIITEDKYYKLNTKLETVKNTLKKINKDFNASSMKMKTTISILTKKVKDKEKYNETISLVKGNIDDLKNENEKLNKDIIKRRIDIGIEEQNNLLKTKEIDRNITLLEKKELNNIKKENQLNEGFKNLLKKEKLLNTKDKRLEKLKKQLLTKK